MGKRKCACTFMFLFVNFAFSRNVLAPIDPEIENTLKQLTLDEKISMLGGDGLFSTYGVPRLQIPSIKMTDGPLGIANATSPGAPLATAFPSSVSLAATWNPELVAETSRAIAQEAKSLGKNMLLAPCVNIQRAPHNGRNFESFGEDPYLTSRITESYVNGVQSQNVIATVKHFALNNQETDRLVLDVRADPKVMDEIYFPAFRAAVKAGVGAVMSSYNKLNGVYASENHFLLTQKLKQEWDFQGLVLSDWGATHLSQTATAALAGLDLEMPWHFIYKNENIKKALADRTIKIENIDEMVRRQLRVIKRFALVEQDPVLPFEIPLELLEAHRSTAYQAAVESMVLLKNENILPLKKNLKSLALIGPNLLIPHSGAGSGLVAPHFKTEIVEEINRLSTAKILKSDGLNIDAAANVAAQAEITVLFLGLNETLEGEGSDRNTLTLPQNQIDLLLKVSEKQRNLIVVLNVGGMLTMNEWIQKVPAVLQSWYPGQEGARAVAALLFGKENPSAKLPISFLKDEQDSWAFDNYPGNGASVNYAEGNMVGYRYLDKNKIKALFPFGYGLSYTEFQYSNFRQTHRMNEVNILFNLQNSGKVLGAEVAQVYAFSKNNLRPVRELIGFQKVSLRPGEKKEISLLLNCPPETDYISVGNHTLKL